MNLWDRELADTLEAERVRRARRQTRRCQQRGCINRARHLLTDHRGKWGFCDRHAEARKGHNRIVERILEIPPR